MNARRPSMRMGSLNILVLVIAISLAVLSVLTFVSAHADQALSDRHGSMAQDTYLEERAGQCFLASLDETLQPLQHMGYAPDDYAFTLQMQLDRIEAELMTLMGPDGLEGLTYDAAVLTVPQMQEGLGLTMVSTESQAASDLLDMSNGCVCGIRASFLSPEGRILDCIVGINTDGTYAVLSWNMTKTWEQEDQSGSLLRL